MASSPDSHSGDRTLAPPELDPATLMTAPPLLTLRPTALQNSLVDMYDQDGYQLTIESLQELSRIITDALTAAQLAAFQSVPATRIEFPQTIRLNFRWAIGAPQGTHLDAPLQHALILQMAPQSSTCSSIPHPGNRALCAFSDRCVVSRPNFTPSVIDARIRRGARTLPLFHEPRIFAVPVFRKHYLNEDNTMQLQMWYPWQFCTNCRAARTIGLCTHFTNGLTHPRPLELELKVDEKSILELHYPPEATDALVARWLAEDCVLQV